MEGVNRNRNNNIPSINQDDTRSTISVGDFGTLSTSTNGTFNSESLLQQDRENAQMLAEAYETEEFSRPSSSPLSEENVCDLNGTCNINLSKILQGETSNDDVALTGSTEEFTSRREESSWNMDSNYDDFRKKLF